MEKLDPRKFYSYFINNVAQTSTFKSLPPKALQYFIFNHSIYSLEEDEVIEKPDNSDLLRLIIEGQCTVHTIESHSKGIPIGTIESGEFIELTKWFTEKRDIIISASRNTVLMEFHLPDLSRLMQDHPRWAHEVMVLVQQRVMQNQLSSAIQNIFKIEDSNIVERFVKESTWVYLRAGEILFRQYDHSNELFVVISGRLNVIISDQEENEKKIGEITPGETVGEMGFFTGEARTATISALRDSMLIKFSQNSFDNIIKDHPEVSSHIINTLIHRLRKAQHSTTSATTATNICIFPSNEFSLEEFTKRLEHELSAHGKVLCLTKKRMAELLKIPEAAQISINNPYNITILNWLIEQESKYNFILFIADNTITNWTKRCLRHADEILAVGDFYGSKEMNEIEKILYRIKKRRWSPNTSLILLHLDGNRLPTNTIRWLENRSVDKWHHLRLDRADDFSKLARFISGKAVGLVLGGGGARGFAHIGVIRALEEENIPIDIIGGTSMGAFIASQYAMGRNYRDMLRINKWGWVDTKPLKEYTLPVFSIVRGKRINRNLKKVYGETQLEDLWISHFCISSNLSTAELVLHTRGKVWEAARASGAIPGVTSPVISNKKILVDGGLLNNLPVDIMRELGGGIVIAVDVSQGKELEVDITDIPSPWKYLSKRLFSPTKKINFPTILDFLARAVILGSKRQAQFRQRDADLYLRPSVDNYSLLEFKALYEIAEIGYSYTKDILKNLSTTVLNNLRVSK